MTRVAVIGNAGGGKSTMCRKLGQALDIAVYPVDKIQKNANDSSPSVFLCNLRSRWHH